MQSKLEKYKKKITGLIDGDASIINNYILKREKNYE